MTAKIQSMLGNLTDSVKTTSILMIVPVSVTLLNLLGLFLGGFMAMGVLTGLVLTISLCFGLMNIGMANMIKVRDFLSSYAGGDVCMAGILDISMTILLTWIGFHMGGLIAGVALWYCGVNLSSLFAMFRLWACYADPSKMEHFKREVGLTTA